MKNILITGGAGFIGSNFIHMFIEKYDEYTVFNLDKLTYAGNQDNLKEVNDHARYKFIKGDICDNKLLKSIFKDNKIKGVIHFAAESHVDNSIEGPDAFIETNIVGTFNLLNAAKDIWLEEPFRYKKEYSGSRFHHISTDEVYGTLGETGYFTEKTPYAPNSPYSASKASSDMLVRSYHHTYGLDTVITNCSNNFGPKQHKEKLIPTIIRKALSEEPIPIYGDGGNIRDWLYVADHCNAVDIVFHKGKAGNTYNIGTKNERVNLELAEMVCEILDRLKPRFNGKSYKELISFVQDRPGHDRRYAIDPKKIEVELGWRSLRNFNESLYETVRWYVDNIDMVVV